MEKTWYRVIVGEHLTAEGTLLVDIQECQEVDVAGRKAAICYGLIYYSPFDKPLWHTTRESAVAAAADIISRRAMKLELQAQLMRDELFRHDQTTILGAA